MKNKLILASTLTLSFLCGFICFAIVNCQPVKIDDYCAPSYFDMTNAPIEIYHVDTFEIVIDGKLPNVIWLGDNVVETELTKQEQSELFNQKEEIAVRVQENRYTLLKGDN